MPRRLRGLALAPVAAVAVLAATGCGAQVSGLNAKVQTALRTVKVGSRIKIDLRITNYGPATGGSFGVRLVPDNHATPKWKSIHGDVVVSGDCTSDSSLPALAICPPLAHGASETVIISAATYQAGTFDYAVSFRSGGWRWDPDFTTQTVVEERVLAP